MRAAFRLCLIVLTAGTGSQAMADMTRLVACGHDTCLLVTGSRRFRDDPVAINGHRVAVQGGRNWHLRLPMAAVRAWSPPYARSLSIATGEGAGREVSLPIGLLGHTSDLAALEVRAR